MVEQALFSHLFVLCAGTAIVGVGIDTDATTWCEETCHLDVFGIHQADEVFHDGVDAVFVKVAVATEGKQIEFQRLAFHHPLARQVADADFRKVWLASDWAQGGKFGAVEAYPIIVFGMLVLECLQYFWSVVFAVGNLFAKSLKAFCFSVHAFVFLRFWMQRYGKEVKPVRISDAANTMGLAMQGKWLYFRSPEGIFRLNEGAVIVGAANIYAYKGQKGIFFLLILIQETGMNKGIDCFIPYIDKDTTEHIIAQLRGERLVHRIYVMTNVTDKLPDLGCELIRTHSLNSSNIVRQIADRVETD